MFPGSIVPQAFTELIRVVKKGGVIAWNIADGYEVGAKCKKKTIMAEIQHRSIIQRELLSGNISGFQ